MVLESFNLRLLRFAGVSALLLASGLFSASAQTVSTTPVGYLSIPITPSPDGVNASNTVVSVPFSGSAIYSGSISSVDTSTAFSSSTAAWTTNQFTSPPSLVKMMTGSSTGRYFQITANTATQVTVNSHGYDLTQILSVGDTFQIVPANTLGSLFGTSSVQFQTGASAQGADNLLVWNGASWTVYYNNGSHWQSASSLSAQDNAVITPDQAIFINRLGTTPLTLTFMGVVPSTSLKTDLPGPGFNSLANLYPVDTTVGALGIQLLPGWTAGSSANNAGDNLYVWNGSAWDVYYYNGTHWFKSSSLSTQDTAPVAAGSAVFVQRQSSASGTASTLTQNLPYSLN